MSNKILVVEDEIDINQLLCLMLSRAGYEVKSAFSGTEAQLILERWSPDVILLDLMLPGMSGEELLLHIRDVLNLTIPILILSAKQEVSNKIFLLKSGADDYITKPFDPEEVITRIEVVLRRTNLTSNSISVITYKDIQLYPDARQVMANGEALNLTIHEFDILHLLMKNPEKVYTRESLYEIIWNGGYYGENNTVNVHVSNIRKKLKEKNASEEYIQTVYGIGFKLR